MPLRLLGGRRCPVCQRTDFHIHLPVREGPLLPPTASLPDRDAVEGVLDQLLGPAPASALEQPTLFDL